MRLQLVIVYILLSFICEADLLASYDFMVTLFFSASCCVVFAMTAKEIDDIFAELFILLQGIALVNYAVMGIAYAWFDNVMMLMLNDINTALLITDIICLVGVMIGDRRLFNRVG